MKVKGARHILSNFSEKEHECWHFDLRSPDGTITREYTPISSWTTFQNSKNLKLLIKLYEEGSMSQILAKTQIGEKFLIGSPKRTVGSDFFATGSELVALACIAGGTGIAPFYQMLKFVDKKLREGLPVPKISLLFSNKKEEDILLKDQLQLLQEQHPTHINIIHTLTREDPNHFDARSGYLFGHVSVDLIKKFLSPTTHTHVFVSGPRTMWTTVFEHLKEVGYKAEDCTELEA